ncbi:MAG: hypothetical protein M1352_02275 [Patescibacteria group bacterium]|nr:hypothetical protein [Patescibacteria group bacterium]
MRLKISVWGGQAFGREKGKWKVKVTGGRHSIVNSKLSILNFSGQTLIETVVALAVVIVLVASLLSVSIVSVRSATLSRNQAVASQLAYKELENVRNARDSSPTWSSFYNQFVSGICTSTCYTSCNSASCTLYSSGVKTVTANDVGTTFTVSISGSAISSDTIQAKSSVGWTDSSGTHTQVLVTKFTAWQ